MATTNAEFVTKAFNGMLFRQPTDEEMSYWTNELEKGYTTPSGLYLQAASHPDFIEQNLPLAQAFYTLLGRHMNSDEMLVWGGVMRSGADMQQIVNQLLSSPVLVQRIADYNTLDQQLSFIYQAATGNALASDLLNQYTSVLTSGQHTIAEVAMHIASQVDSAKIGLGLMYSSLFETTVTDTNLANYDADYRVAVSEVYNAYTNEVASSDNPLIESDGRLTLTDHDYTETLTLDLTNTQLLHGSESLNLLSGSLAEVTTVDARPLGTSDLNFTGTSQSETVYASANGDTLQGGNGNDTFYSGSSTDTFVFEADARANGADTIFNFDIGAGGDILDFSNFLKASDTSNIALVDSDSTNEAAWSNGQVLISSGYSLDSVSEIAALFGAGSAFSAPNGASKAILITADIVGDAHIWAIVNQTGVTAVDETEVTLIGTLNEINNLSLVNFDTANFA